MDVLYSTDRLRKLLTDERALKKKFGDKVAQSLMICMKAIELADNLSEVPHTPPTNRHKLQGNLKGCFSVGSKKAAVRIIFRPESDNDDLVMIEKIEIVKVEDYHG